MATTSLARFCNQRTGGYHPLQSSLVEFEPSIQQQLEHAWQQSEAKNALAKEKSLEGRRKKAAIRIRAAILSGFLWSGAEKLLDSPLGVHMPSDLDIQPAEDDTSSKSNSNLTDSEVIGLSASEIESVGTWTDANIVDLHYSILMYSLGVLNSRGNGSEKKAILGWIWSDDSYQVVPRVEQGVTWYVPEKFPHIYIKNCPSLRVRADQIPFTFQTCCRLNGYHFEEIRDGTAWAIRDFLRKIGFDPAESYK